MSLRPGTLLGPYRIDAAIGAGGMGEVYRASDTRLDRTVAIKVLPEQFANDAAFRDRFEREARAIGGLNHPHICTLYDIGHEQGADFLVLEYLEGQTLADRISKGPVPVAEALAWAIQVGDALDKAHTLGIIHRDLKPGNVMITKAGAKLLDFGLAKTAAPVVPGSLSMLPTTPANLTVQGTILGTFQYMAPEQLEGQEADARSDLFAFGTVLYEMLTGRKAFEAKTQAGLIGAILEREPTAAATIQPAIPPALEWVMTRCLEKDPARRWQTARDLVGQLEWIARGGSQTAAATPVVAPSRRGRLMAWAVAGAMTLATVVLAVLYFARSATPAQPVRFQFSLPPELLFFGGAGPFPAVSPDGRHIVFIVNAGGQAVLALRSLETLQTKVLAGTEGAGNYAFWSPDSRFVGFFAQGKLKKIDVTGGPPQALCDAPGGEGGTWNQDGTIVFAPTNNGGLFRVSAAGGTPAKLTTLDTARKEAAHIAPWFLPDGRHFLYVAGPPTVPYVGSLDSSDRVTLVASDSKVTFAAGHLLFVREGTLLAQPFDPGRLKTTGEAFPIVENVAVNATNARASFAAAGDRVLTYRTGASSIQSNLTMIDRAGKTLGQIGPPGDYRGVDVSPDGSRVAVHLHTEAGGDIWVLDAVRGTNSRFTFDANRHYTRPVWSADGSRMIYSATGVKPAILEKPSSGAGQEQTLLEAGGPNQGPTHVSRDGRFVLYTLNDPKSQRDVWALPLFGDRRPFPVLHTEFNEDGASLSSDGRWIAYQSNESGRYEVYVQPFPLAGGKWQISTSGGDQPRWRRDGKELYYLDPARKLMAVAVQSEANQFRPGVPTFLFESRVSGGGGTVLGVTYSLYAPVQNGERFLVVNSGRGVAEATPVTVVLDWTALLRK